MLINQNKQTKYLLLNTNDKTDTTRWNIPTNYNFSQKAKMALVSINNATDTNLNMVFCPTIKDNHFSSLNTHPLIYSGIGYNNQNIINGKQYYDVNGAYFNEIELKTFSCPPQNNFSYPELDGLRPNLWLKFDTGAITTDYGTDNIYVYNINATPNGGVSVRGNDSVNFNGTNHYLTGTINNTNNNFWSVSFWVYNNYSGSGAVFFSMGSGGTAYTTVALQKGNNKYSWSDLNTGPATVNTYPQDLNNWVHLVYIYNENTERIIYRNGIKEELTSPIIPNQPLNINTTFTIGKLARTTGLVYYYPGYIDDLRVYTGTVLNQDQINKIYNNTRINYPIIKNESYKLANPADNDPNIHTIPNVWYRFDTGAITTNSGTDIIILTNGGTVANAGVSVRGDNSASFNGTNQYLLNVGFNFFGIAGNSWSASAWAFSKSLTMYGHIFGFGNESGIFKRIAAGFNFAKYIITDANTTASSDTFNEDLNIWVHLVFTFNSQTLERSIYRNGVKLTLTNAIAGGQSTVKERISIGTSAGSGSYYNGFIDDARVYTGKVLDQEEITRIYNGTKTDYTTTITEPTIGMDLTPNIWLKFDTGALLTNDGTNAITLTNFNASTNAGISMRGNNSISFNGTNQYLTGTGLNLTNNGSFSISIWIYPKALSVIAYNIICQFYKTGQSCWFNFSNLYKYEFGGVALNAIVSTSTFATDLNTWVHLVINYDKTTNKIFIYRNGVLLATSNNTISSTAGLFGYENTNFSIGATNTPANFFNGNIDDFRVYNRVLSQAQITEIYAGNTYYNLPTAPTKYNTEPTNTQYQFEVVDDEQKIINHY